MPRILPSATRYVIVMCALTACIPSPILLDRAIVRNQTSSAVSDVMVRHEPTNAIGRVSAILPRSELDLGFYRQPLKGKRAVVTWKAAREGQMRVEVVLPRGRQRGAATDRALTLVYTIRPDGAVTVHLEP